MMHLPWELQTQLQQAFVAAGSQLLLWPDKEEGLNADNNRVPRWSEHDSAVPARNDPVVVLLLLLTDQSKGKHV